MGQQEQRVKDELQKVKRKSQKLPKNEVITLEKLWEISLHRKTGSENNRASFKTFRK